MKYLRIPAAIGVAVLFTVLALATSARADADQATFVPFEDGTGAVVTSEGVYGVDKNRSVDSFASLEDSSQNVAIPRCMRSRTEAEAACPQFFTYVKQNWFCFYCALCQIRADNEILCREEAKPYIRARFGIRSSGERASSSGAIRSGGRRLGRR
ncbi:MAG: hypothetical protein O2794_00910 [bacterium]|nr:hypothetical protein [bacterium]